MTLVNGIVSLVIFYLVYRVTRFYIHVNSLPPGPLPLPFVGNFFDLMYGSGQNWSIVLANIAKRFGPVFTVWYGESPRVIVTDIDLLRDKFNQRDFAGRTPDLISEVFITKKRQNVVFGEYGPEWEALRRVTHAAVTRYAVSQELNLLVIDCVDHTVDQMLNNEGINNPFVPFDYIFDLFLNISAASAYGHRCDQNDPDYKVYKHSLIGVFEDYQDMYAIWESFPITRFGKRFKKFKKFWDDMAYHCITKFVDHYKDYDENVIRDFCDTLITAKNDAIKSGKESATYLTDNNLGMAVSDLLFAGTDTSQMTFRWILLHMLNNEDFLAKLRHEIDVEIGDRMPTHEDKSRCHYVMAFITEVFRHSPVVPIAVPHKAVSTSQLGEYTIPSGTEVACFTSFIQHQDNQFAEPHVFRPERFLQRNGHYVETKHKAFIPFGVGRRKCLGDKMAVNDLFLVLVRFIQKTSKYRITLHMVDNEPLLPDPKNENIFAVPTKTFRISFDSIKKSSTFYN